MRRAAKRDGNEAEIIQVLQQVGADVYKLNDKALPDLLVGFRGTNYLLEVKMPKGKLTQAQKAWWDKPYNGQRAIVHSVDEALDAIGLDWDDWTIDKTFGPTLGEVTGIASVDDLGS